MDIKMLCAGLLGTVLLVGCGSPKPTADPAGEAAPPAPSVIGDPLHRDLERAEAVEGQELEHKQDLDEAIEKGSGEAGQE